MDAASFKRVYDSLQEFHAFFADSFGRKQWREHSRNYLQALLVPEERRSYGSKTELALEMLAQAMELGHLKAGWVAGDDAFRMSPSFREGLAALGMWYVPDVPVAPRPGPWSRPGPVQNIRGPGDPANPGCGIGSAGPWSSAVMSCRRRPGVR